MKEEIRFEDLELGQHLWVLSNDKLLIVMKDDENGYQVCGAWEGGFHHSECEIIELINRPKGYEETQLYYLWKQMN